MSIHTSKSQFSFELPSLSYIDAKWEEPDLRIATAAPKAKRREGLGAWLSSVTASFAARRQNRVAASELASMSDHELMDIGISRSDISRVFDPEANLDLRQRSLQV